MASGLPAITDLYYVLSQSWLPALKYHRKYKLLPRIAPCYWVFHGLWLNSVNHRLNQFRNEETKPIEEANISEELAKKMDIVWLNPIDNNETNAKHRNTTLLKHGSCAIHWNRILNNSSEKRIISTEDYLSTATELATKYNMGQYLRSCVLGHTQTIGNLVACVEKKTKVIPHIHFLTHQGVHYLDQIYLYFDTELNLINSKKPNAHASVSVVYLECRDTWNANGLPTERRKSEDPMPIDREILTETPSSIESEEASTSASHER